MVLTGVMAIMMNAAVRASDNWPDFRGPGHMGIVDATDLPLTWSESENVKWKTAIHGKAWSSPVIWGDQIWMTTADPAGHERYAVCVDRNTGKIVHDMKLFEVAEPQFCHDFNSYASPSPVIEAGRVYVTFGSAGTACIDTATGKVLWTQRDLYCNHFRGAGASPILFENLLILPFDGSDYQFICAMDKNTGKVVWKTNRSVDFGDLEPSGKPKGDGDFRKGFATPLIAALDGKPVLLSPASKAGYAYDPRTGEELWRIEEKSNHSASSRPVAGNGLAYFCTGLARGQLWAVRPGGSGVVNDTNVVWKVLRGVPKKPSPLLVDGLIYMCEDSGVLTCLDAMTGQEIWKDRIDGTYSASPIYAAGRIYFFEEHGKTTVIEAGKTFKKLAENTLDDGFMASPAVVDNALYLRTRTHLYRIEK
ncbi:MAG: PQQ-binding-like beta-propeller repeat protein [Planctomycetes bacterium]|nr:PQQ-binding-like beta-propeller repeat protein [Planctomycetota bacterium]